MSARPLPPSLLDSLRAALHGDAIRRALSSDSVDNVQPDCVAEPTDEAELARILRFADALNLQVAPRGSGSKADWGNMPSKIDLAISTARLNRVLEHAHHDMTVIVEAGTPFALLQQTLARHSQRLALDPLWPERATIGGIIATNDSGSLRLRYGSVRDLIIGITVALPNGTLANSGGRVVKNVAGYDLPKLMTGALGTLGIITKAVFRLHPLPEQCRTISIQFQDAAVANRLMLSIADSTLVPTGMQLRASNESSPSVDVRFEGIPQSVETQVNQLTHMPGEGTASSATEDVWLARESLCNDAQTAVICKLAVLPTEIAATVKLIRETVRDHGAWSLVAQSVGIAFLRLDRPDPDYIHRQVSAIRSALANRDGTLVVLHCPANLKNRIDIWGPTTNAHSLMRRIKERFDPKGTLNRGRFVGGI